MQFRGLLLALALAGCSTTTDVDGPRAFNVQTGFTPAGVALSSSMPDLVARTNPSYVTLIVHKEQGKTREAQDTLADAVTSGSGFLIDKAGHVVTAGHVAVAPGNTVSARAANGRLYEGTVVDVKRDNDMALLRLSGFGGSPVVPAASPCMASGDAIFSLGKPHAQGDTARIGEVQSMSFGRAVSYNNFGYPDAVVLRMSTRKGESGGPVFNSKGELTGMLVSTLSDGNGKPLHLAHAVSSDRIGQFICKNTSCSARWRTLAAQNVRNCPA